MTELHNKAEVANSISADSNTIAGSFPPNSKKAGIKRWAAAIATCCPISTLPVHAAGLHCQSNSLLFYHPPQQKLIYPLVAEYY